MTEGVRMTRYERVQEILDRAAGTSAADYGIDGRFWHLRVPQLLEVEIHGVRMIAPAGAVNATSCCGHEESAVPGAAGELQPHQPGRGATSGLVRGLRGLPPFDGTQLPRLPWGGTVVAEEEIAFISDWIDDGCPENRELASFALSGTVSAPALAEVPAASLAGVAAPARAVYADELNEYRSQYGEVKQRVNLDCMTPDQLEKLRWAFRELYKLDKWPEDRRSYNNIALIHQNHCQHGWERFLPWHRVYLYEFEQTLQDICPGVTLPYWDWTMPQYMPTKPECGWIIPPSFKAFLTSASIDFLEKANPPLPRAAAEILRKKIVAPHTLYTRPSEFFAAVENEIGKEYTQGKHRDRFIDALLAANALWYPLRYPAQYEDNKPINEAIHYHYPTADDIAQIMALRTFLDFGGGGFYNDSYGFLDQNPHNTMHIWTGGQNPNVPGAGASSTSEVLRNRNRGVQVAGRRFHTREDMYQQPQYGDMFSNLTASYDPVFWPIHVNVDRLWTEWQQLNPQALPQDLDSVLTPWSYTLRDTLDHHRFGYEYVKCSYLIPVGLAAPVGRFVSQLIGIPEAVRGAFRQAEVRLHRVPQLPRSCFIRVFLNLADANAATPVDDGHYAGYLAIFGHGPCYGGPGHCDLPPSSPRRHDLRPRSHNTPRNHRINVTKTAQRLIAAGAASLQITLVVIGADYREDNELLRLDGVSLSFLD